MKQNYRGRGRKRGNESDSDAEVEYNGSGGVNTIVNNGVLRRSTRVRRNTRNVNRAVEEEPFQLRSDIEWYSPFSMDAKDNEQPFEVCFFPLFFLFN